MCQCIGTRGVFKVLRNDSNASSDYLMMFEFGFWVGKRWNDTMLKQTSFNLIDSRCGHTENIKCRLLIGTALDFWCDRGCFFNCHSHIVDGTTSKNFYLPSCHWLTNIASMYTCQCQPGFWQKKKWIQFQIKGPSLLCIRLQFLCLSY